MLFISIMLIVWFGFWLYFAWKKNEMLEIITCILINIEDEERSAVRTESLAPEDQTNA